MSIVHVTWPSRLLFNKSFKKEAQDVCFVLGFLLKELIAVWPSNSFFAVNLSGQASSISVFRIFLKMARTISFQIQVKRLTSLQLSI